MSALESRGISHLREHVPFGKTATLLGSSGVGKSTIINCLMGEDLQPVCPIREDDGRGRHTTTCRKLFILPGGGIFIDTPGMRELQLWDSTDGVQEAFRDIEELALNCRFRNCRHDTEPRCAVQQALANGELEPERFASYMKLKKELGYLARKQDTLLQIEETKKWKRIHKAMRRKVGQGLEA